MIWLGVDDNPEYILAAPSVTIATTLFLMKLKKSSPSALNWSMIAVACANPEVSDPNWISL